MEGVIAHEITHCVLNHAELHSFSLRKKERSNKTKKIIAQSLAGIAIAAIQVNHVNSGVEYTEYAGAKYNEILQNSLSVINQSYDKNTHKYGFSYSRKQEVESDIVACLFLIWLGENPNYYIESLDLLRKNNIGYIKFENSTHPSLDFRIKVLKDYFLKTELYVDQEKNVRLVPKYKRYRFLNIYPKSKKVKKEIFNRFKSDNQIFLSHGKYYVIPLEKVSDFLRERTDSQLIGLIFQ